MQFCKDQPLFDVISLLEKREKFQKSFDFPSFHSKRSCPVHFQRQIWRNTRAVCILVPTGTTMGFQVTVYSALFVIFCHAVSGSPLGKLRFDDGSYNVQTANLKMEFNLGPKGRKINQEESPNSINRPAGVLRKNFNAVVQDPYKNFIPPRPLVDDGYRPELDPMIGREEDARRVIDSTLYFDTVDHEKMVLNYADRRHDGDLAPMRFHSIRPFFAFSDYHPRGGFFRF